MTSPFTPLLTEKIEGCDHGRQLFRLALPLRFSLGVNGGGVCITVPSGFVTDFASVPRVFWTIFPPAGQWCEATVLHDYLCKSPRCSRFFADACFREAMFRLGVPTWRRVLMYYGVRLYAVLFGLK